MQREGESGGAWLRGGVKKTIEESKRSRFLENNRYNSVRREIDEEELEGSRRERRGDVIIPAADIGHSAISTIG